jgi:hypothetical protein
MSLLTAPSHHDGYDPHIPVKARTVDDDRGQQAEQAEQLAEETERRLAEGAWLRVGEVALLFGVSRFAVDYWIKNGGTVNGERFFPTYRKTFGGWRELDPVDVKLLLDSYRKRRTGRPPATTE